MSPYGVKDPNAPSGSNANKACLLQMEFSLDEVDFALEKLGEDAPIDELVDFIVATHIAEESEEDAVWTNDYHEEKNEDSDVPDGYIANKETLLRMDFSLDEIHVAMEKLGEDSPLDKLVNYIIDTQAAEKIEKDDVYADHCNEEINPESMDKKQQLLQMGFSEQEVSASVMINGLDKSLPELVESIISGLDKSLAELVESIISGQATSFKKKSSRSSGIILSEPANEPRLFGGRKGAFPSIGLKDKGKMKIIEEEEEEEDDDED